MFLPLGDTPNPRGFVPWVNWLLIGANVAVYLFVTLPLSSRLPDIHDPMVQEYLRHILQSIPDTLSLRRFLASVTAYDVFVFAHGYKPAAPQTSDLFFSMFLHANFLHLAGNMLFLWIYGDNVEHRLGRAGYLLAYLGTGTAASLTFALFSGSSMTPMVGASGAISGVLGIYFVLFPRNGVKVFILLFPFFFDVILLPARLVLGFFILFDNLLPFMLGAASGVAYGAHIGGFAAGLAAAWSLERAGWRWPWQERLRDVAAGMGPLPGAGVAPGAGAPPGGFRPVGKESASRPAVPPRGGGPAWDRSETAVDGLRAAIAEGDAARALAAAAGMDRGDLADLGPGECVRLAGWLESAGYSAAAARLLRSCIAGKPRSRDLAGVYLALGLLRLEQGQPTAAYQHLLSVFDHDPSPETAARAREALDRIDVYRRRY